MQRTHGVTHYDPDTCPGCKYKTLQLRPGPAFRPHYNYSVGKFVNNEHEYREALKMASDHNSERTGITHQYEYIPPSDLATMQPPETADPTLDRLVAKDEKGRAMHAPIDDDPTDAQTRLIREQARRDQDEQARKRATSEDLIDHDNTSTEKDLCPAPNP